MTKAIETKIAEEGSKKELVSNVTKSTSICGFFLKNGKCYRAKCMLSHKINSEEKCQDFKEKRSDDCLDSATKPSPTYLSKENNPEKMPSSQVNTELDRVERPHQEINEEELKESLKCSLLEKCTPQFCCTCQVEFPSQLISNAHYAGKPHQRLLQMKLKIMLRKRISEDNLKKKQGDTDLINSATSAAENKQIVTVEMQREKNNIKEETRKRPGDHLDENYYEMNPVGALQERFQSRGILPQYLVVQEGARHALTFTFQVILGDLTATGKGSSKKQAKNSAARAMLDKLDGRVEPQDGQTPLPPVTDKANRTDAKKLRLLETEQNPNNYTCSLCQVTCTLKVYLETHLQGSKHKSKEAQQLSGKAAFFCDVCHVSATNEAELKKHLIGKPHAKKLRWIQRNKASFVCEVCGIKTVDNKSLEMHLQGSDHRAQVAKTESENKSRSQEADSRVSSLVEGNGDTGIAVEEADTGIAVEEPKESRSDTESISMETAIMVNENTSEQSVNMFEKMDDSEAKDIPGLSDSMNKLSSEGDPGQENMVEEMEKTLVVESKKSLLDIVSIPMEAAKMQTTLKMNGSIKEISIIKDEEVDDGEDKDIPDLSDSMSNLVGYGDILKNKEFKITLNLKAKELLNSKEINKSPPSETSKKEDIVLVTEKSIKGVDEREDEASSDDDLIILENPDNSSPPKPIQHTQNLNSTPLAESVKLCMYPLGQSESVTVSTQDYATLAFDTFLNDIIIDFYLLYLANNVLSNSDKEKVHIFSTMFYKRLMQSPRADAKKVPEYENDVTLTSAEIRHFRVASWTKNVDLFSKDMLIIPICEESHWYLLLVVKPGIIFLPIKSKERKQRGDPFMIVLDSVGGRKNTAVKNIRRYLACEWNKKKCDGAELLSNLEQIGKNINTLRPNKPEQENKSDCGIFLLQYVDKVFQNVSAFMWPFLVNSRTREWFTSEEVAGKRGEIAQLIKRLTKDQKPGEVIQYPNIKFTAKAV